MAEHALIVQLEGQVAALEADVARWHYDAEVNPNILDRTPYYNGLQDARQRLVSAQIQLQHARASLGPSA
jgi:hypothetical protein